MAVRNAPSWLQAGSHSAEDDRLTLASLLGGSLNQPLVSGILAPADLAVTQNGTPNMSVNIASGSAWIVGTESSVQGVYNVTNDAAVNVAIATANGTNPRIDLIVAQVLDDQYSGASHIGQIVAVTGTPAASPSVPATPKNSIVLAQVRVNASVTSILTANITDARVVFAAQRVAAGHLTSNAVATTSLSTFLTTASLSPGIWVVTLKAMGSSGAASQGLEIQAAAGTATATLEGATSDEILQGASSVSPLLLQFVATITVAGTLIFQHRASGTTGSPGILFTTLSSSLAKATGYTATREF